MAVGVESGGDKDICVQHNWLCRAMRVPGFGRGRHGAIPFVLPGVNRRLLLSGWDKFVYLARVAQGAYLFIRE